MSLYADIIQSFGNGALWLEVPHVQPTVWGSAAVGHWPSAITGRL